MRRFAILVSSCLVSMAATPSTARRNTESFATHTPATRKEIIAVYIGTSGTNMDPAYQATIRRMRASLTEQARTTQHDVVLRGVSLDPLIDDGLKDLATLGVFDEISVGGNWTNLAVVRYLGPSMGRSDNSTIPQVVVLERDVTSSQSTLDVGSERELARFHGARDIVGWINRGAPFTPR